MKQREITLFWLPLFASWLLMTAEGPLLSAAVNRLPNEVVMLAALGIVFSLAVTIESPVINLLSTSTALVRDLDSYHLVRRFTLHTMFFVTAVGALIAFTPVFHVVVDQWLDTPPEIAHWVKPGLQILVLWSTAIGWRRFLQGILIRFGHTRVIARGTMLRLVATGGTALALLAWGELPGIHVATFSMLAGVFSEAIYATLAIRPVLEHQLPKERDESQEPLTYGQLFWFHLPLTATSLLTLLAQPLVTSTLARLDDPELTLAAWPLIFQAMLVLRAGAFALPEVVIALGERPGAMPALRRFSLSLAVLSSLFLLILVATPLAGFYLVTLQDTVPAVAALTHLGLWFFIPLPALATFIAFDRGVLIQHRKTRVVNEGMMIQMACLVGALALGLSMRWPGMQAAAAAVVFAWTIQWIFLGYRTRSVLGRSLG